MPYEPYARTRASAAALFLLVISILIAPLGAIVINAVADTGGGTASSSVTPDATSDQVAATAAEFRVDESGSATYSIPIYGVPGTAGVAPKLSLNYSNLGGYGPLGKGWSIGGLSSISRCRATREAGDFPVPQYSTPDGNPAPINFTGTDRFCLDGQRLISVANAPACAAMSGMGAQQLRTEIDSFQRVCAYASTGSTNGPAFFTVERKDGSISWYGDRDSNTTANRADGYFETNSALNPAAALSWAQTRFQDSTGNYIDYLYAENPSGTATREHLISEIRYTGKTLLSGQTGSAKTPYAKFVFTYSERLAVQQSKGYISGGTVDQLRRLDSITACAVGGAGTCAASQQARFYKLTYAVSVSGNGLENMASLQECRDSSLGVCMGPTNFTWSQARNEFATSESTSDTLGNWLSPMQGMKWGDVDGDGRQDMVFILEGDSSGTCSTETVYVAFSSLDASNKLTFQNNWKKTCTPAELLPEGGNGTWHLLDYDGDGRDDLFVSGGTNSPWRLYRSMGRTGHATKIFDDSQNLLAGLVAPITTDGVEERQLQLTDLNGDGLLDIIYPVGSAMAARLMARNGSAFEFGPERSIVMAGQSCRGAGCTIWYHPTSFMGFNQLFDINGDGSSDVLIQVNKNQPPSPDCTPEPGWPCVWRKDVSVWPYVISGITASEITMTSYGTGPIPILPITQAGDFNGDGLTDFAAVNDSTGYVVFTINTGTKFISWPNLGPLPNSKHLKVVDVNGDGRSDLVYPDSIGANKTFVARLALANGGFAPQSTLPGGNAVHCYGSGCNVDEKISLFGDYDGDGAIEHVRFNPSDGQTGSIVSRAGTSSQYVPRDVITQITNGLGAQTDITYAPLTNKELYRRDTNSRNTLDDWGRGSPVMDLLAPSYAVARVSSSSPQAGAPTAKATVHYRYTGARVQSGGRGFLGFRTIETIDPNQAGAYVVTTTSYAQNFPYIGMPVQTVRKAVSGQAYLVPTCLNSAVTDGCFATLGQPHTDLGGSWFSDSMQDWESAPASLATQVPLHVRTGGTEEKLRDPFAGGQTSRVVTTFGYGSYGNVTSTSVDTFTAAETAPMSTVVTTNTYSDDTAKWRLGRLTGSTVTHSRPGQPNVVRIANFAYSMSGAATGQLTVERTQSGGAVDQDLRKEYTYDDYGNQTVVETCANPATACSTTINFHPATPTVIQRYARTTYDSIGRFPVTKVEPFWNGAGAVEKTVSTVVARNIYGDVTQAYDLNGVDTLAVAGTMGRPYYSWAETVAGSTPGSATGGAESWTTYRWCGTGSGQVNCPTGAKFRQQISAEGAGRQWAYFDVLGRPVMKAAETFNVNVINKDVTASCIDYDATGKSKRASNPFFLAGTSGTDGPTGLDGVCTSDSRLWTTTTYDLLGRPTRVESPDPTGVAAVTNTYNNLTTGSRDPRGNLTNTFRNGKGEVWQTVDSAGLLMVNYYTADGNLGAVHRNAGRGVIANQFSYDALGRKISQNDPDSGLSQFQYNALGELIVQIDNNGQRIENEYDGRGRVWRRTVRTAGGVIETQSLFTFDTAGNGVGQLAQESITGRYGGGSDANLDVLRNRFVGYDSMGRAWLEFTHIDGISYGTQAMMHDALGRPWRSNDVTGRGLKTEYNARGQAAAVCEDNGGGSLPCPANATTYQRTLETDAWGHVVKERRGNSAALDVTREYQSSNGRIFGICAGNSTTCNLMDEGYAWDLAGNLSTHQKENRYAQLFTYDSLNRLTEARTNMRNGVTSNQVMLAHVYDRLGNICRKTEWSATKDYSYVGMAGCGTGGLPGNGGPGIVGPHQVSAQSAEAFFYYDSQGNQTLSDVVGGTGYDRTVKYSADNKAYEIAMGVPTAPTKRLRFWYGADGQRYKQEEAGKQTLYLGNVEVIIQGAATTFRRSVPGGLQTITGASVTRTPDPVFGLLFGTSGGTATVKYLFADHLGSLVRVVNADGSVAESLDNAPYGERRNYTNPDAWGGTPTATPRGFTGHEHLDGTGVIHMNGRIYSSSLGRFLQPDPLIQAPGNAQSWNAYTYCFNNPLTYTDPTGMMSDRAWDNLWAVAGIAVTIASSGAAAPYFAGGNLAAGYAIVAAGGFMAGYATSGTFKGGLTGAFSAVLFAGIGEFFSNVQSLNSWAGVSTVGRTGLTWGQIGAKVLAHGAAGGVMSRLQGGKFGHGVASAGFTEAVAPGIGRINGRIAQGFVVALVGGTASAISGGKFANGAMTAAFSCAFNQMAHPGFNASESGEEAHSLRLTGEAGLSERHYMLRDGVTLSEGVEASVARIADTYFQSTGESILVTSGTRTPAEQADAMYTKFRIGGAREVGLYRNRAAVTNIYNAYVSGLQNQLGRTATIQSMTTVIERQVANNIFISAHLRAGAVDIQSSMMSRSQLSAFRLAATPVATTIILETSPPHWHLQF